jgi:putative spermidine/putrescine transport system permease protein
MGPRRRGMAAVSRAEARRAGRARLSAAQFYWLLILPAVVLIAGLYFFPLVKVLLISVSEPEPGFGNYAKLIS